MRCWYLYHPAYPNAQHHCGRVSVDSVTRPDYDTGRGCDGGVAADDWCDHFEASARHAHSERSLRSVERRRGAYERGFPHRRHPVRARKCYAVWCTYLPVRLRESLRAGLGSDMQSDGRADQPGCGASLSTAPAWWMADLND